MLPKDFWSFNSWLMKADLNVKDYSPVTLYCKAAHRGNWQSDDFNLRDLKIVDDKKVH